MLMHQRARELNFVPSLHLHPYFMFAGSEGSPAPSLRDDKISNILTKQNRRFNGNNAHEDKKT